MKTKVQQVWQGRARLPDGMELMLPGVFMSKEACENHYQTHKAALDPREFLRAVLVHVYEVEVL